MLQVVEDLGLDLTKPKAIGANKLGREKERKEASARGWVGGRVGGVGGWGVRVGRGAGGLCVCVCVWVWL